MRTFRSAADAASAHHAAQQLRLVGQAGPLPPTLHDVQAEQQTVRSKTVQLQAGMDACIKAGKIPVDAPIVAQWNALALRGLQYADQDFSLWGTGFGGWIFVTPNDLDRGFQLERDLQPWFEVVSKCSTKMPTPSQPQQQGGGLGDLFNAAQGILPWVLAYLVVREFGRHGG